MIAPITDVTGLPADLRDAQPVFETTELATARRSARAQRLYLDGRLYAWSDTRRVLRDGLPRRVRAPAAWRLDAQVSEAGMDEIRALLDGEAFRALPPSSGGPVPDRSATGVRAVVAGSVVQFVLVGTASAQPPAAVREVQQAITRNIVPGGAPIEN